MPENQNANGERWTQESVAIAKQLGWTQKGTSNFDIECVHHRNERRSQPHGVDSFFEYYDPYYQGNQGILVESKCWQFKNITTSNIKKWIKQMTDCMECMQVSPTIQALSNAPIQNALLMCWSHDEYETETFITQLSKVGIASKRYPCNIFVASNHEIWRWCSLINTVNTIKSTCQSFKYIYPNVPTLGTNLILADHLTLTHLFSKYVFAEVKQSILNVTGGNDIIAKLVVFCFEPASVQSLEFLYDLIKRLNFQSYRFCEVYLYEREVSARHITEEFLRRVSAQTYGDLKSPSKLEIKYLDIFDGMMNIPDAIIHFGEA